MRVGSPALIVRKKMTKMRFTSFVKAQAAPLLFGLLSTIASVYLIIGLVHAGIDRWFDKNQFAIDETTRGQANPGGSAAFGTVFALFVAVLCWWSVISDWREARRKAGATSDAQAAPD